MKKTLRRILLRWALALESDEASFLEGFDGVPGDAELAVMPTVQIARSLNDAPAGSVKRVVYEHALNMRLAKVQAKATLGAGWIGLIGAIVAAFIAYYLGVSVSASKPKDAKVSSAGVSQEASAPNAVHPEAKPSGSVPPGSVTKTSESSVPAVVPSAKHSNQRGKNSDAQLKP